MRSLIFLVTTTAVVSGLRDSSPGFAVDFHSFGGSPVHQDLPYREQSRLFRETGGPPSGQHNSYRQESYRDYRPKFHVHEETRIFRDDLRGGFKDGSAYVDDNREGFNEELRIFNDEARPYRDDTRIFKDEARGFREDTRHSFRDERIFRDDTHGLRDGPRNFREEPRPYREDTRNYRDGPFRDEIRTFEGARNFRDEVRPFRSDVGAFRDESTRFREDRPFRDESGPLRNEARPIRPESRPFKDELLFTQESQTLAEAQHRFNKEQQHRQPLSFGGHSNYLKYGNHGLGFASIPSVNLPLEDNSPRLTSGMMITEMTTAATQTPNFLKSGNQVTSSLGESSITKSHMSVTLAPEIRTTPIQSSLRNTINSNGINQQRTNENLINGGSMSPSPSAVTIATSGGSVTPKVLFTTGSGSMSGSPLGINGAESESGVHQDHGPTADSLHVSKQGMNVAGTSSSYYPSEPRSKVPEALLKYVFKYQMPEDTKTQYAFRDVLQPETFNQIQALPLIHHHQTAKYAILPELKIPSGLTAIRQPGGPLNYVATAGMPKVPYLTANSPAMALGTGYSTENLPTINFASNLIQLDRDSQFANPINTEQIPALQTNQYPQLRQLGHSEYLPQLGQYGDLGQAQQASSVSFNQGGLQLQLGGFGGIDYNGLSANSESSRPSAGSTFAKLSFGQPLWQL